MSASTNQPIPLKGGDEQDYVAGKRSHSGGAGKRKPIKRGYQRRVRRVAKAEAEREARGE